MDLKDFKELTGLTLEEVSDLFGYSKSMLSMVGNGKRALPSTFESKLSLLDLVFNEKSANDKTVNAISPIYAMDEIQAIIRDKKFQLEDLVIKQSKYEKALEEKVNSIHFITIMLASHNSSTENIVRKKLTHNLRLVTQRYEQLSLKIFKNRILIQSHKAAITEALAISKELDMHTDTSNEVS